MNWFKNDSNDEKLKRMLRESRQNFNYDHESGRLKLLQNLNPVENAPKRASWVMTKYAVALAGIVFLFSATFAFTSNAKPGEKLFILNKWGEQVILSLPLSSEQKINIETQIVTKRLEALDNVKKENKVLETVKESDISLNAAVEKIITNKARVKKSGDEKKAQKMDEALERLEERAAAGEEKMKDWENKTKNEETKAKIRAHRERFQKVRAKVRLEILTKENGDD